MSDYKRMSRDELIGVARELEAALARATAQEPEPSSPSRTLDLGDDSLAQFEQCPQPMYIFDPATLEFLQVNAAAVSLYGYSVDEFLGMKITDIWLERGNAAVLQQIRNRPASYLYYRGLRQHRAKSGDLLEVEIVGQDVLFHGRRARVGLVMDVTEEHHAMRELRESEERYRELVELSPDAIYISSSDRTITYVNAACVRLLGASSPDDLVGKGVLEITHPDFHEEIQRRSKLLMERDEPLPPSVQKKLRLDGAPVDVEVMAAPFVFQGKRGTQVVMRDITERKRAEEELARTNAELEKFVLVASHDLQEPLRTTANAALLLDERHGEKLVGEAKELLKYVVSGVMHMRRLIDSLLVFSGIGAKPAAIAATDCRAVMTDVLAHLRAVIEESGAVVDCGPLPVVRADPSQLEQVLMNLISNAIKFRRGALQIQVEARREDSDWIISVADNGIGINPAYSEKIFEIFERLDTHYPGTGVGLAICKKIVESNKGRIWVESQEGRGAKFSFTVAAADANRRPNA